MASRAVGSVGRERPGGLIQPRGVTGDACGRPAVIARILHRSVREDQWRPVGIAMTVRAVVRGGQMVGDLSRRAHVVMTALAIVRESRVIEAGRAPREGCVAVAALSRSGDMSK